MQRLKQADGAFQFKALYACFRQVLTKRDIFVYSKTCLKHHSKIYKTKVLRTNGSLMKVKSIAEAFCNSFDLQQAIVGLRKPIFGLFEWPFKTDNMFFVKKLRYKQVKVCGLLEIIKSFL